GFFRPAVDDHVLAEFTAITVAGPSVAHGRYIARDVAFAPIDRFADWSRKRAAICVEVNAAGAYAQAVTDVGREHHDAAGRIVAGVVGGTWPVSIRRSISIGTWAEVHR